MSSIISPKTGKWIKVGGPAYELLLKSKKFAPLAKKAKRVKRDSPASKKVDGRGSRTRGWKLAAPKRGKERHSLKEECGDVCFLKPSVEGFPICAALREKQGCEVDCRALTAAKTRAAQWGYPGVYRTAESMQRKYKC